MNISVLPLWSQIKQTSDIQHNIYGLHTHTEKKDFRTTLCICNRKTSIKIHKGKKENSRLSYANATGELPFWSNCLRFYIGNIETKKQSEGYIVIRKDISQAQKHNCSIKKNVHKKKYKNAIWEWNKRKPTHEWMRTCRYVTMSRVFTLDPPSCRLKIES